MKDRKQHYVWEHYLGAWAVDGQLWCQGREARFRARTEEVAHYRDFYRLKEMSELDVRFLDVLSTTMAAGLRDPPAGWGQHFRNFVRARLAWEEGGRSNHELERDLDVAINDIEEYTHVLMEDEAVPLLSALRDEDASKFGSGERFVHFARFVATQYLRTPSLNPTLMRRVTGDLPPFNLEASWGLMRTIFATGTAAGFYARRRTLLLTFLEAPAEAEFLTGDQPMVNTRAIEGHYDLSPKALELYYPLTPTRALLIDFDQKAERTERRVLSADEVLAYNELVASSGASKRLYARSENALIAASRGLGPAPGEA